MTRISAVVENKDSREFTVRSSLKISWWKQKIVYQKSAPLSKRHIEIRLQHSDRIPLTFFKSYSTPLGYSSSQGCNGRFSAGKTDTVAATSPVCHRCCRPILFPKVKARQWSYKFYILWRPCYSCYFRKR